MKPATCPTRRKKPPHALRRLPVPGWGTRPRWTRERRFTNPVAAARDVVLACPDLCRGIQTGDLRERFGLTYAQALRLVLEARTSVCLRHWSHSSPRRRIKD